MTRNIGIITTWFERGAAYVSKAYFDTLSLKHNVFIYARGGEKFAINDPRWDKPYVTWGKVVSKGISTYIDWEDFSKWIEKNKIDILIFNEQNSWDVILRAKSLGIPLGAYIDYYTQKTVPFFWLYDFLLCNTQRHYGVFRDHPQVFYIPWGTNTSLYSVSSGILPHKSVTFFHSCGMSPYRKGTDILVEAFQKVKGNAELVIHSQVPLDRKSSLYDKIECCSQIRLIEQEIGAPGLYYMGDIYVYPSRLDGIGLSIAEALASGLPVITTDEPPMSEFIPTDSVGKLVPVERYQMRSDGYYWPMAFCDIGALSNAMQFYVDNVHLLGEHQRQARLHAEQSLDWENNSQVLNDLIENVDKLYLNNQALVKEVERYEMYTFYRSEVLRIAKKILNIFSGLR